MVPEGELPEQSVAFPEKAAASPEQAASAAPEPVEPVEFAEPVARSAAAPERAA
jgi:hypothetical protein